MTEFVYDAIYFHGRMSIYPFMIPLIAVISVISPGGILLVLN